MIIGRIRGATRVLGKPEGWDEQHPEIACQGLPILDLPADQGGPAMVSAWFPTPDEVKRIIAGEPVYLSIFGHGHPPVALWVPEVES